MSVGTVCGDSGADAGCGALCSASPGDGGIRKEGAPGTSTLFATAPQRTPLQERLTEALQPRGMTLQGNTEEHRKRP